MSNTANLAIQVLPLGKETKEAYAIIDQAIAQIKDSGMPHQVCPFETVVEGSLADLLELIPKIQQACHQAGGSTLLLQMKLHMSMEKDLRMEDKLAKYS